MADWHGYLTSAGMREVEKETERNEQNLSVGLRGKQLTRLEIVTGMVFRGKASPTTNSLSFAVISSRYDR